MESVNVFVAERSREPLVRVRGLAAQRVGTVMQGSMLRYWTMFLRSLARFLYLKRRKSPRAFSYFPLENMKDVVVITAQADTHRKGIKLKEKEGMQK